VYSIERKRKAKYHETYQAYIMSEKGEQQQPTKKELLCFVCDKSMSNDDIVIMHKSCYDDMVDGLR
jgi:hypothetical protein